MPILSFQISEKMKETIRSVVQKTRSVKSQSSLIRDALDHFICSSDGCSVVVDGAESAVDGQILFSMKNDAKYSDFHRVLSIEERYPDGINAVNVDSSSKGWMLTTMSFRGNIRDLRSIVGELSSLPFIEHVRYIIQ